MQSCWRQRNRCQRIRWWPPLVIVTGVLIYLAWAGPYTELPADAWDHIARSLNAQQYIASGHFYRFWIWGNVSLPEYISHQGWHWNTLHALLCKMSGITTTDSWLPLSIANTIVFCLAIYWFAMFLWSCQRIHRIQKIQASLWTTCFAALWLGVSVFAYIRYYTLAPTILNYVIYLAVIILVLDYLRSPSWWSHAVWLAPILLAVMNVIHTQEVVFAFFMSMGIIVVLEGRWVWSRIRNGLTDRLASPLAMNMLKIHVLFVGGLIIVGLLFFHSLHKPMASYSDAILKPVFNSELLHQTWFVQPLTGQFFQVVTWWGLFTYALFLIYMRRFLRQPFILAGMLMPLLTVFNPLTLAILTRWVPDTSAIYRFNYMIPLPFVAGFMAMHFSNEIKRWIGADRRNGLRSSQRELSAKHGAKDVNTITTQQMSCLLREILFRKTYTFSVISRVSRGIWAAAALLGLVVLLMPFEPLFGMKSNSRFYTLKPVPEGNDQRRWSDLIALVRTHPQAAILSDSYTSAILRWLSIGATDGDWWLRPSVPGADRLALLRNLERRRDWWLVVNRRNGEFSTTGHISGHWPADILMCFATFYPEDLILFIKQHPELFKEIWSKDQIQVYDIVESRLWE